MTSESAIQMEKDVHLCFLDYAKAFEKVRNKDLFQLIENLHLFGKDRRIMEKL